MLYQSVIIAKHGPKQYILLNLATPPIHLLLEIALATPPVSTNMYKLGTSVNTAWPRVAMATFSSKVLNNHEESHGAAPKQYRPSG